MEKGIVHLMYILSHLKKGIDERTWRELEHVQWITACAMIYSMCNELQHVQWITAYTMNYSMYNDLQHVQWITACTMNYSMCNELQHVQWITACAMNYNMCHELLHVQWITACAMNLRSFICVLGVSISTIWDLILEQCSILFYFFHLIIS